MKAAGKRTCIITSPHSNFKSQAESAFLRQHSRWRLFLVYSQPSKKSTRPYLNNIPSHFINDIKAKGYKVIGFNVFLISLLADPAEGPAPSPLDFKTKRRPEGLKKLFLTSGPPHLKVWIRHCSLMRSLSPNRLIWSRLYYFYSLYPLQEKRIKYPEYRHMILEQQNMQGNEVYQECDQQGKRVTGWPFTWDIEVHKRYQLSTESKPSKSKGEVSVENKTKIQWETHPAKK